MPVPVLPGLFSLHGMVGYRISGVITGVMVHVPMGKAEALDQFISESGLAQWNSVRVLPLQMLEEGMTEIAASSIF